MIKYVLLKFFFLFESELNISYEWVKYFILHDSK